MFLCPISLIRVGQAFLVGCGCHDDARAGCRVQGRCLFDRAKRIYKDSAAAAESLQSCPTLCDPTDGSSPGSPVPGILQARTLGLGCHFLLQCMKVKSQSEVAQSCPSLSNLMDCSLPDSSVHGIFQARVLEWGATAFSTRTLATAYYNNLTLCWLGSSLKRPRLQLSSFLLLVMI